MERNESQDHAHVLTNSHHNSSRRRTPFKTFLLLLLIALQHLPQNASSETTTPTGVTGAGPGTEIWEGEREYNFTLAFLAAVSNNGNSKFTAGAFFLALEHLNQNAPALLNGTGHIANFLSIFRDTKNSEHHAVR